MIVKESNKSVFHPLSRTGRLFVIESKGISDRVGLLGYGTACDNVGKDALSPGWRFSVKIIGCLLEL